MLDVPQIWGCKKLSDCKKHMKIKLIFYLKRTLLHLTIASQSLTMGRFGYVWFYIFQDFTITFGLLVWFSVFLYRLKNLLFGDKYLLEKEKTSILKLVNYFNTLMVKKSLLRSIFTDEWCLNARHISALFQPESQSQVLLDFVSEFQCMKTYTGLKPWILD